MLAAITRILLGPLLSFGEKYLDNQKDKERLKAATDQLIYAEDGATRRVKLSHLLGRIPLFLAECSAAAYVAAILIDSTVPMEWLTPLELPNWFKPHFHIVLASIFGIAMVERRLPK